MPPVRPDRDVAGSFTVEWFADLDDASCEEYEQALAQRASMLLRAARFVAEEQDEADGDVEARVWIEAAPGPGCVSITWEPGPAKFGFHLLDETCRERLACIVFDDVPCMDGASEFEVSHSAIEHAEVVRCVARDSSAGAWVEYDERVGHGVDR